MDPPPCGIDSLSEMDAYTKALMSSGVGMDAKVMESRRKHTGNLLQPEVS